MKQKCCCQTRGQIQPTIPHFCYFVYSISILLSNNQTNHHHHHHHHHLFLKHPFLPWMIKFQCFNRVLKLQGHELALVGPGRILITVICKASCYHIRALRHVKQSIDSQTLETIACAIVGAKSNQSNQIKNLLLYIISNENENSK